MRSNFTPEIVLWRFLRMRTESGRLVQNTAILAKIQVQYKSGQGELYYGLDILPKSTTMAVSAHAQWQIRQKESRSENMVHLRQVQIQKRIVMYNFANKWLSDVQRMVLSATKAR